MRAEDLTVGTTIVFKGVERVVTSAPVVLLSGRTVAFDVVVGEAPLRMVASRTQEFEVAHP